MEKLQVALLGLGVMGQNLALNMNRNGWRVGVWNRHSGGPHDKVAEFVTTRAKGTGIIGYADLGELVAQLRQPRVIFMMVKAGDAVDGLIEALLPMIDKGDIIIDGGNSFYKDSGRRAESLAARGISFVGCGISGGEEGALYGASIMPGGDKRAWPIIEPLLKSIAAKGEDGTPCCDWIGSGGSGHYVKMIHNGIEYGDMQFIAETYHALKHLLDYDNEQIAAVFDKWNGGRLQSYLVEITSRILTHKEYTGDYLLDKILDASGQKGTGKWSAIDALQRNGSLDIIASSVFARNLAAQKELRMVMARHYSLPDIQPNVASQELLPLLENALYASRIVGYAQGFSLMRSASDEYNWNIDLSMVALIWRAGCIIRSAFLNEISRAYRQTPYMMSLLLDDDFTVAIKDALPAWEKCVALMQRARLAVPVMSAALGYFHGVTTEASNANMIQAMRDYFGAHTFERTDSPRGEFFHEEWGVN